MQVRFVEIIFTVIDKAYIIAGKVHVQGNIRMMCRVVVHQWHKETEDIHDAQQGEQKDIRVAGKEWRVQSKYFRKVTVF